MADQSANVVGANGFSVSLKIDDTILAGIVSIGALSLGAYYLANRRPVENAIRNGLESRNEAGVIDPEVRNIEEGSIFLELHCHSEQSFIQFAEDFEVKKVKHRLKEEFKKIGFTRDFYVAIRNAKEVYRIVKMVRSSEKERKKKKKNNKKAMDRAMREEEVEVVVRQSVEAPWRRSEIENCPKANKIYCQYEIPNKPAQYGEEFHGCIPREEAEELVSRHSDGCYLVRESDRVPGEYRLTLRFRGVPKNFNLFYAGALHYVGEERFINLDDLVDDGLRTMYTEWIENEAFEEMGDDIQLGLKLRPQIIHLSDDGIDDELREATVIDDECMEGRVERTGKYGMLPSNYVEKFSRKDGSVNAEGQNNGKHDNEKAPYEILARGPLALQTYQKALQEGKTRVKRVPIMLIGQGHSGKTSLKQSLKGEKFNPDEKCTSGIEMDPCYFKVSKDVWKVGEKTQARNSQPFSYEQSTGQFIINKFKEAGKITLKPQLTCGNLMASTGTSVVTNKEHIWKLEDGPRSQINEIPDDDVPKINEIPDDDVPKIPDDIATVIEKLLQEDGSDKEQEEVYSILWDFGGQSVYYVTHPLFLTTRAIYLLVCNLSWDPNGTASPQVKPGLYKNVVDVFCDRSNADYLDVWMSSVSGLVSQDVEFSETGNFSEILPERLPPVFLVCTHADKPYQNKCPFELAREIYGTLKTKIHGKHLIDFFVVDNTKSGSEEECSEVKRLRQEVLNVAKHLPQIKEVFPIKWLKYEKELQSRVEEGVKWIYIDEARKIAKEVCEISCDAEFQALLNLFNDQRIVIHFNDSKELNRMVILDLQWLVDVFKKVIAPKPSEKKGRKFSELWLKLETTGILEERLLQHVWSSFFDSEETSHSLVALMEKFYLLCPWSSSAESSSPKEYLVPSMLMFPPKEDVVKLFASAGIPSLFLKFKSGQVPPGLFPRLVLMFFQWCTKKWLNQSHPQLHHNFARFYTHPAEGFSVILLCHFSFIEVVVHKEASTSYIPAISPTGMHLSSELQYDTFQINVAHIVRRQLSLMLECMPRKLMWLKNIAYEMSVCCPVCCRQGYVSHCRSHNVSHCKKDECRHLWSESELRESKGPIICTKSAVAEAYRVPLKFFEPWFKFADEQGAIVRHDGKALSWKTDDNELALALPSGVLEALQLQTCDANDVVALLQESLSLERTSLEQPDPETKRQIRCLCMEAKNADRLDVVKKLREIVPAGTTGPLLPEALDVVTIPLSQRQELTINLGGRDEWKLFAERLRLNPAEILYLDKRVMNPCDAALTHSRNQGYITCVGDVYDALVDCDLPVMADLL